MADTVHLLGVCGAPEHSKKDENDSEMKPSLSDTMSESDTASEYDFTRGLSLASLPSLVLVTVFRMLSVHDRYHLSLVCKRFYDLFHDPSVWRVAVLTCSNDDTKHTVGTPSRLPENQKTMAVKFGHYFEDVTLRVNGLLVRFDDSTQQLLSQLNHQWKLHTLTLQVGSINPWLVGTVFDSERHMPLSVILDIVRKAEKLKKLNLIVWPLNVDGALENLLMSVTSVELRSVNFFCKVINNWYGSVSCVNCPVPVKDFVSRLNSLQCLCIQHNMLSDELLLSLASSRHCQLKSMSVLVYTTQKEQGFSLQREGVHAAAWSELRSAYPYLVVSISLVARASDQFFSLLFQPEIPLCSVTVHEYSRCSTSLLKLLAQYSNSLKSLVCYTAESDCEEAFSSLLMVCPHIQYLIFWGKVHRLGIESFASLNRERKWTVFQFKENNIITQPPVADKSFDEDIVVQNVNGIVTMVSMNKYLTEQLETEEERKSRLQMLKDEVSKHLGYEWTPDE